jgi:alkylation response protein AidB-like acyl-CoA dehydrogenase
MFDYTEEQRALKKTIGDFAEKEIAPHITEWDEKATFSRDLLKKAADLGLTAIAVPEEYGGTGLDYFNFVLILEEFATRVGGPGGFLIIHNSCENLICQQGTEEQRQKFLPSLVSGDHLGAIAITEPNAGSDVSNIQTSAVLDGDAYVLNGSKCFISHGGEAQVLIVVAKTDKQAKGMGGISTFIVTSDTPGFTVGKKEDQMGARYHASYSLSFDDCRIPKENLLGAENKGMMVLSHALDEGRIGIASTALGIGQAALNAAVKYSKERVQFGRPIASFQGLQFMMADMATELQAARLLTYNAATLLDKGDSSASQATAMAKMYSSDAAMRATINAVQIFGGYGYMKEYTVERYMREAKALQIVEGANEIQRIIIARELLK